MNVRNSMNMSKRKEVLERKLSRLETSLSKEKEKTTRVMNNIGWGAGMRRTKCTPSFKREDELNEKIEVVKFQLIELRQDENNTL